MGGGLGAGAGGAIFMFMFLAGPVGGGRRAAGPRGGDFTLCGVGGGSTAGLDGSRDTEGGAVGGCCGVCSRDCCCDLAILDPRRGDETRDAGCE